MSLHEDNGGESQNTDCTAVTVTTARNPCLANRGLLTHYGLGKEQQNVRGLQNKVLFFFSFNTAVIRNLSFLPFSLSISCIQSAILLGACASCRLLMVFFPVMIFFLLFSFSLRLWQMTKVVLDTAVPCLDLGVKFNLCHVTQQKEPIWKM